MTTLTKNRSTLIKWGISVILAILPLFIPLAGLYTPVIQKFLVISIFGVALLAFELLNGFIIILMMSMAWILTGVCTYTVAFSGWATSTCMIIICSLTLIFGMQRIGLLNRIGYKVIVSVGGSFKGIIWGLFICGLVINTVGFVMSSSLVFAFAYALYVALGLTPQDKETVVIVGTTIMCGIQSSVYLYCPLSVSVMGGALTAVFPDYTMLWTEIMYYNWPTLLFCIVMTWGFLKWYEITSKGQILTNAQKGKAYFAAQYEKLGPMKNEEKKGIIALLIVCVFLFSQPLHGLDSAFGFMLGLIFMFLPGINIGSSQDLKTIPWDTSVFVVMGFLAVGTVGTQIGLTGLLSQLLLPFIASMGEYWSVFGTFVMGGAVNLVLSPFAMMAMLPSLIGQYCTDAGFNFLPHVYAMYQARDFVLFPYEYPMYLILFSFGMIGMSRMIKVCIIKSLLFALFFAAVIMPYWHFVLNVM